MSEVLELFGSSTNQHHKDWKAIVDNQECPFLGKKCYKVRKSNPDVSIGTCTILYGTPQEPLLICPARLIDRRQIFADCLHLLTLHEPGNELHIVQEVQIPGGSEDYFLVSVKDQKVKDFVGVEVQALDTTGTIWPARQRLLAELKVPRHDDAENSTKPFGINWKMTAKTILVQMHHKIRTFENVNRKLVLVLQNKLLDYMAKEFNFSHLRNPASIGDAMHIHAYELGNRDLGEWRLILNSRMSTDVEGVGMCLGLQAEAKLEMKQIVQMLQKKISQETLFTPV